MVNKKQILKELDDDIKSKFRMFRLIQGDVGSGKTILALISAAKFCRSNYQVAYMSPTEILSNNNFMNVKSFLEFLNIKVDILSSKTSNKNEKTNNLSKGKIDLIIGTHALFQKKIKF